MSIGSIFQPDAWPLDMKHLCEDFGRGINLSEVGEYREIPIASLRNMPGQRCCSSYNIRRWVLLAEVTDATLLGSQQVSLDQSHESLR